MPPARRTVLAAVLLMVAASLASRRGSDRAVSGLPPVAPSTIQLAGPSTTQPVAPTTAPPTTGDAVGAVTAAAASTTLPPGVSLGLDDYDGDGQFDPTCGTQDFGAGLVLRVPCHITTSNPPPNGTTLVPDSLYGLPRSTDIDLSRISGQVVLARDDAGKRVLIVLLDSAAIFDADSDAVGSTDTLDATIQLLNTQAPRGAIQLRGHTDAAGEASANRERSERRAAAVRDYLRDHGTNATSITSVGLGSAQPLAHEHTSDGSDSEEGRRFNRRVEVAVRVPG